MSGVLAPPADAGRRALRGAAVDRDRGDAADRYGWRFARGKLGAGPLAAWTGRLAALGFAAESRPTSEGTPFANTLLVGRVVAGARP